MIECDDCTLPAVIVSIVDMDGIECAVRLSIEAAVRFGTLLCDCSEAALSRRDQMSCEGGIQ
jgi:hypothetical protein